MVPATVAPAPSRESPLAPEVPTGSTPSVGPESGSGAGGSGVSAGSSASTTADFEEFVVSTGSVDPLPLVPFEDLEPTGHPVRSGGFKYVTQFLYQGTEVAVVMLKSSEVSHVTFRLPSTCLPSTLPAGSFCSRDNPAPCSPRLPPLPTSHTLTP
jgi:hypothetical protein